MPLTLTRLLAHGVRPAAQEEPPSKVARFSTRATDPAPTPAPAVVATYPCTACARGGAQWTDARGMHAFCDAACAAEFEAGGGGL